MFAQTGKGYSAEERKGYLSTIINNVMSSMHTLLKYSQELRPQCPIEPKNQAAFQMVNEMKQDIPALSAQQAQAIAALWYDRHSSSVCDFCGSGCWRCLSACV
jgi:hypothetical protein